MTPTLAALRASTLAFSPLPDRPDPSWLVLEAATAPAIDLALPAHRDAAHAWLNAWGCRIRKPRPGEPGVFDAAIADWWDGWSAELPAPDDWLVDLADDRLDALAACFTALAASPAAPTRTLGPTAASKLLFALRPKALMPWDNLIAQGLHGARDGRAYRAHLATGRGWARAVLAEAAAEAAEAVAEPALVAGLGRTGWSLAKVLDEYCYLVHTRGWVPPAG
ncbi:hypothetical protein [Actinosynnema pretiosum]|uniref:Uncharacterized protein n=1 Tax=Actinosynnema pretiosum TaxID=42197 RepID=A0A290Z5A6_9PSEU|nr:hypothetical protein [Actinosynnema pretiosum]ATE54174.1 hypothetical protein CNX65_13465 [Actinosynnema pretiosum]